MTILLDGKETAKNVRGKLRELIWNSQLNPRLCIVQGGDRKDSDQYVRNKIRACKEVGIDVELVKIEKGTDYVANLKEAVLEANEKFDAVIVQLPIPYITEETQRSIIELIDKEKDVDCLRLDSEGEFYSTQNPQCAPCTPMGIMTLLKSYGIEMRGKKVCIIGRSKIVGRPVAELMIRENATVTVCHSRTPIEVMYREIAQSDIVISAAGVPELINECGLQKHCKDIDLSKITIVDVGTNYVNGKWMGDVEESIKHRCHAYSPVPGGVGPMTIASLMQKVVSRCLVNNYS